MPSDTVIIAFFSLLGTFLGTFSGMAIIKYRIEQLEKKVEKHNNIVERMYKLEGQVCEVINEVCDLKKRGS